MMSLGQTLNSGRDPAITGILLLSFNATLCKPTISCDVLSVLLAVTPICCTCCLDLQHDICDVSLQLGLVISDSTPAHPVWLPGDHVYKRYSMHKDSMKFRAFTVTQTLKTAMQFLHKTPTSYDNVPPNYIWLQKHQQFSRYSRNGQIDWMSLHCGLDLEDGKETSSLSDMLSENNQLPIKHTSKISLNH